jgi:hypothetical protein
MNPPEPSLTFLRMTSPNSVRVGAGVSFFNPSAVAAWAVGSRDTVLFFCMPSMNCSVLLPGDLLQYSRSTYWIRPIGMLLMIRVRRATSIVKIGSTGGGRRAQSDVSAVHWHLDLPAWTVEGSLRHVA